MDNITISKIKLKTNNIVVQIWQQKNLLYVNILTHTKKTKVSELVLDLIAGLPFEYEIFNYFNFKDDLPFVHYLFVKFLNFIPLDNISNRFFSI